MAFATTDPEQARAHIGRVFAQHRLEGGGRLAFRHETGERGPLSFHRLEYGAPITVRAPALERFYLLQLTLAGSCEIRLAGRGLALCQGQLVMLNPTRPYTKRWSADCRQLILRLDRDLFEGAPEFEPVATEASALPALSDLAPDALAQLLLDRLPHRAAPVSPAAPGYVRRAEGFMRAHAGRELGLAEIAEAAGVSPRALHRGFQQFRALTPMASLKAIRLDRARAALLAGLSVTEAAGPLHLGRFAQDYGRRFGESPAATRARRGMKP